MTKGTNNIDPEREIVSSRIVNAPIDIVFKAWTDPYHLARWWGPAGFSNTFNEFDLRPGGKWSFTMHGPDKGHYKNDCVFIRIDKPVFISWYRVSKPLFTVVVSFEKITDDQTKLIFRMQFESVEERNKLIKFVPDKNEENFDKLEVELSHMIGG